MDEEEGYYRYEWCDGCLWRTGELLDMCTFCDEGDQYEEDDFADGDEPYLTKRKVIRIKETA